MSASSDADTDDVLGDFDVFAQVATSIPCVSARQIIPRITPDLEDYSATIPLSELHALWAVMNRSLHSPNGITSRQSRITAALGPEGLTNLFIMATNPFTRALLDDVRSLSDIQQATIDSAAKSAFLVGTSSEDNKSGCYYVAGEDAWDSLGPYKGYYGSGAGEVKRSQGLSGVANRISNGHEKESHRRAHPTKPLYKHRYTTNKRHTYIRVATMSKEDLDVVLANAGLPPNAPHRQSGIALLESMLIILSGHYIDRHLSTLCQEEGVRIPKLKFIPLNAQSALSSGFSGTVSGMHGASTESASEAMKKMHQRLRGQWTVLEDEYGAKPGSIRTYFDFLKVVMDPGAYDTMITRFKLGGFKTAAAKGHDMVQELLGNGHSKRVNINGSSKKRNFELKLEGKATHAALNTWNDDRDSPMKIPQIVRIPVGEDLESGIAYIWSISGATKYDWRVENVTLECRRVAHGSIIWEVDLDRAIQAGIRDKFELMCQVFAEKVLLYDSVWGA